MNHADTFVACYYFPNYHPDPRNEKLHGKGWTEWELVKRAKPRFEGHDHPHIPLWGYEDESDPVVNGQKIDAAADHGIDGFIFDWYWYDDGPFLRRGLENGFLGAHNNKKLKFAIMWANHDWIDIHPARFKCPAKVLYHGSVKPKTFEKMTDYVIEKYFTHPSYWTIGGCPYFSFYELFRLIENFGGVEGAAKALQHFRNKVKAAGFPGLHLNAVNWGVKVLPCERIVRNPQEAISYLGFDSVTSYVWVHHVELPEFPHMPYEYIMKKSVDYWYKASEEFKVPYHPNVTMGWDASPRTDQASPFKNIGYPYMSAITGNTPSIFKSALVKAKQFLNCPLIKQKILTVNCWNEWTEGSYLEPDTVNGMGYLEAIKDVFGRSSVR